jgi:hypothetical protein
LRNREKGGTQLNSDQSEDIIRQLYESGRANELLEEYILACSRIDAESNEDAASTEKSKSRKKAASAKLFPNLAGFCRYLGISTQELSDISRDYPSQYGKLLAVLEDEALNSSLSPTLISAYLKKRLGYASDSSAESSENQLQIKFEHDIFEDGA